MLKKLCSLTSRNLPALFGWIPVRLRPWACACGIGMAISLAIRIALTIQSRHQAELSPLSLLQVFGAGLVADYTATSLLVLLVGLPVTAMSLLFRRRAIRLCVNFAGLTFIHFVYLFTAVGEIVFWDEFESRFNFIAVDYLAYTTEVVANIWESYPMVPILAGILAGALALTWCAWHGMGKCFDAPANWKLLSWLGGAAALTAGCFTLTVFCLPPDFGGNRYDRELSCNGMFTFCNAFIHNQLDYSHFYEVLPENEAGGILKDALDGDIQNFTSPADALDIRRSIAPTGAPNVWNVVVILEESLSASFVGALDGGAKSLTPEFDRLCQSGMLLARCFASGTRTVRGIEAVELSQPPTPGQSIVKRPGNGGLHSMGKLFREHGYACTFLYGGNGFFDNMNTFFSGNGYEIQDSTSSLPGSRTFSNAWGYCDGDVFQWAIANADACHTNHKPFHQFILTTSNHRPYTFPEGVVDVPQKHRSSAVRYSDHALAEYLRNAEAHPWFARTLFVVIADHCHSTSGRSALPLDKYHIPALFYNPMLVKPQRLEVVCSQIDIAPTIFGMLNWSYVSQFFGSDVRSMPASKGRAFPGTFTSLGYLDGASGNLVTLQVRRRHVFSRWTTQMPFEESPCEESAAILKRAISFYQIASQRYKMRVELGNGIKDK